MRRRTVFLAPVAAIAYWSMAVVGWLPGGFADLAVGGSARATERLQGMFVDGVGPYKGEGTAIVADAADGAFEVRFTDFKVSRGPDLHVWLVAHPDPRNNRHVQTSEIIALGPLKANSGDQAYDIPAGTDFEKFRAVVVWCKAVNSLFAAAALR